MRTNSASRNLINVFGKISDLNIESDKLLNIYNIPNHYQNYKRLSLYFGDWRRIEADCLYLRNKKEFERLLILSKIANFKVPYNFGLYNNNNKYTNNTNNNNDNNNNIELDPNKDEQLLECSDFVKNCKFIYFGNLNKFIPTKNLKSLIIPLDLYSDFYDLEPNNYSYFEKIIDSNNIINTINTYNSKDTKHSNSSDSVSSFNSSSKSNSKNINISQTGSESNIYQRGLNRLNNAKTLINFLESMESIDKILLCADNNNTWNIYHKLLKYS